MWDIAGFDSTYLRPVFAATIKYAAGPASGQGPMRVLCMGLKTSAGNLVLDAEIRRIYTREDANTAAGEGSQLARMLIKALRASPNVELYAIAVTEAVGGTAATITMLLAVVPTSDGTITLRIAGETINVSYAAGTVIDTIGTSLASRINAQPDCPFTATYAVLTDTLTLTARNVGVGTKAHIVYQDMSLAGGLTSTITGSAVVNAAGSIKGVRAGVAGGAGTEDYTAALGAISKQRYARIAVGTPDVVNAALVKSTLTSLALVTVQTYDQAIYGHNGTQGEATALAQTTLNDPRHQVCAARNSETHPSEIAAGMAALRAATEGDDPVPDYDGASCAAWIAPTAFDSDTWLASEENALLNAGVTPIKTQNATAKVVRAICTYSLNGAVQDTRCLDIGDAVFPDWAVLDLQNLYDEFRQANKYVGPDPDTAHGELEPSAGVGYPALWVAQVKGRMTDWFLNNQIEDTFSGDKPTYPIAASYNVAARRIQSNVPFVVRRVQHQLSVTARQTAPAI